jgi:hypothetical protein
MKVTINTNNPSPIDCWLFNIQRQIFSEKQVQQVGMGQRLFSATGKSMDIWAWT